VGHFVVLLAATAAVSVGQVQLLSDHAGFVAVRAPVEALLATDSAGRAVRTLGPRLPRATRIDDFTFLDRRHGWVVGWNLNDVGVSVYRTTDGGRHWKSVAVTGHSMAGGSVATIQFLDLKHGWLVNQQPTAPDATLYSTTDGGAHWRRVRRSLGEIAPVLFTSSRRAWQAGGPFARSLYRSTDAGRTWREMRLRLPSNIRRASYDLPVVFGNRVLEAVSVLRRGRVELRIYGSPDSGDTWKLESSLKLPSSNADFCSLFATRAPPAVGLATSRVWRAAGYYAGSWHAYSTEDAGRHWHSTVIGRVRAPASCAQAPTMQALDSKTAWFRFTVGESDGRLYATKDGGRHWRRLRLNMP
jgi:photosystem II stability/assembly factor-like uncharacterized protein